MGSVRVRRTAFALGVVMVAALMFLVRAVRNGTPAVDFSPVWLAGVMWNAGSDPYSADFAVYARRLFPPPAHLPVSWVYPAQWMLPARLLALLDYDDAKAAWLVLSIIALAMSVILLWRAADRLSTPPSTVVKAGATVFLLTMEATGGSLFLGQTGYLMMLGVALLLHGLATERPWEATIGLILLFLKPQFGIVFAGAAMAVPALRRPTLAAIVCTGLACLCGHALSPLGFVASLAAWLSALGNYNDNPFNAPAALTGLILIDARISTVDLTPFAYTVVAAVAAPLLVRWLQRHKHYPFIDSLWLGGTITAAVIAPLHMYDFSFIATLLLVMPALSRHSWLGLLPGMLLMHRARMIAGIVAPGADILHSQAVVTTLGAGLILVAVLVTGPLSPMREH